MSAEVICIGTELLLGDIVNTNAQFFGQQLASLGVPHYYQSVVGDNPERIKRALQIACDRAEILLFAGGLGPTPDDLTTATLADFFDSPLRERPEVLAEIEAKFARRGRTMSPSNRKQALFPDGAEVLPNPTGSAPGIIWQPRPGLSVLTFPGVPGEMQCMWYESAVPYLKSLGYGREIVHSRMLRFWGIGESTLAEKVRAFLDLPNPTVAPYASRGEVRLRISARAPSEAAAREAIAPIESQLRAIAGPDCFGVDDDTLASAVGRHLCALDATVAVAESCTGGGLGHALTSVPGSSAYFRGGIIAYQNAIKTELLGVAPELLARQGAVSADVAEAMAAGVRTQLGSDWAVGITGIAGPDGGTDTKPIGLVYVGLADPNGRTTSYELHLGSWRERDAIRHSSVCNALDRLRRQLLACCYPDGSVPPL
ncbi:competence/damage-inducible protein CinA C-terminal domain protein [Rubidibacter lacunae KORDI 51-2]|uniref:CinA-like protein n=1 Tax=Rubidibacter lacunae KORDI 51-2 TaxID=582515 RepID=U5DN22_9CHRO|nr:competence/damage-inducible protein A [Rubidibacter lacunae]ERN43066.1 competence/damage-inducible protein CinA C-terminal domain protein [Rubidibacter lacunae KORDI 51-2]